MMASLEVGTGPPSGGPDVVVALAFLAGSVSGRLPDPSSAVGAPGGTHGQPAGQRQGRRQHPKPEDRQPGCPLAAPEPLDGVGGRLLGGGRVLGSEEFQLSKNTALLAGGVVAGVGLGGRAGWIHGRQRAPRMRVRVTLDMVVLPSINYSLAAGG
jgi:hypothetical protein